MSKDGGYIEVEGKVTQVLPGLNFIVTLNTEGFEGYEVKTKLSGKMRMHSIRVVEGDRVKLEISPHNLEQGRITFRHR